MTVRIINKSKHPLPAYATELSAGMDIRANLSEPIALEPLQRCLVPTGLYIALPAGFEAQIRPRSGLAIKKGISVLNSPGTIDADYRGEICIILVPFTPTPPPDTLACTGCAPLPLSSPGRGRGMTASSLIT